MNDPDISFGPVLVLDGVHKGRIGYLDDEGVELPSDIDTTLENYPDEDAEDRKIPVGYVYFGEVPLADGYFIIPLNQLREVTTADLISRLTELHELCNRFLVVRQKPVVRNAEEKASLLTELHYVETNLLDRLLQGRFMSNQKNGAKVFISHSSKDKVFATWIGTDLKEAGHTPWFDEWDIRVGESIPQKISEGLSSADFVIVVLSENSAASRWVEREWQVKYWSEIESGRIQVLPVLLRDCEIPQLLKTKKYADFRVSYNDGLADVLHAINSFRREDEGA